MVFFSPLCNWQLLEGKENSLFISTVSFIDSFDTCLPRPRCYNALGYKGDRAIVLALKGLKYSGKPSAAFQSSMAKCLSAWRENIELEEVKSAFIFLVLRNGGLHFIQSWRGRLREAQLQIPTK